MTASRPDGVDPAPNPHATAEQVAAAMEDTKLAQVLYHDWEAETYDDKWSISYDERCIDYAKGRFVAAAGEQPAGLVRTEGVLRAGEVRLGWICKETRASATAALEMRNEFCIVHPHVRQHAWHIGGPAAFCACELANPVDRIVIVEGQEQPSTGGERIGLAESFSAPLAFGVKMTAYSSVEARK